VLYERKYICQLVHILFFGNTCNFGIEIAKDHFGQRFNTLQVFSQILEMRENVKRSSFLMLKTDYSYITWVQKRIQVR
jgi:hypothetical protein